ncbi:SPOSA6832_00009, partial [Sporobolomyces salmonicolor]
MPRPSSPRCSSKRSRSTLKSTLATLAAAVTVAGLGVTTARAAPYEPAGDQVLLGMWFDSAELLSVRALDASGDGRKGRSARDREGPGEPTIGMSQRDGVRALATRGAAAAPAQRGATRRMSEPSRPRGPYSDSPSRINNNLGYNVPVFQIAQAIPLPKYNYTTGAGGAAPENQIELSATDAAVFLTVYPTSGFAAVTDDDFTALGQQILNYQQALNRTVFLRYAPEMQGTWMTYGMQPTEFNTSWHSMYNLVKAVAPETIMVWAPNTPQGYPYGQGGSQYAALSTADQAALDTNHDGQLTGADDAFSPYWPGTDVVDWIGLSIYYKGLYSDIENDVQPDGYCALVVNGTNPEDNSTITPWYNNYCAQYPDKACMFAEAGAAWHVNDDGPATQAALQQQWLKDCYPRIKLFMQFEYEKTETSNEGTDDLRDYRLLNNTDVLNEFKADLASLGTTFSWANSRAPPTSISSAGAPAPATNSAGSTVLQAITATTRAKPTGFPSLFGSTSDGTQRAEFIELGVMLAAGVVGAGWVMRNL